MLQKALQKCPVEPIPGLGCNAERHLCERLEFLLSTTSSAAPAGSPASPSSSTASSSLLAKAVRAEHSIAVRLPSASACLRKIAVNVLEAVVVPAVTFYAVLETVSLRWALIASLLWAYLLIGARLSRRRRVSGVLLLSAGLITARTVVAFAANSSFVYFLQPSLGNMCIAVLFLASVGFRRPLTRRLAEDFCALPKHLDELPRVARFFSRLTILWAFVCAANGAATLLLLLHESLGGFLALRPVISYGLVAAGTAVSYLWFRATLRREGLRITFG